MDYHITSSDTEKLLLDLDMSPIKKERIKKRQAEQMRKKLREDLPVLTIQEIRKYRMPYYETLFIDLTENGFVSSAQFLKQLIDLQEKTRKKFGPGTTIWMRPLLKESKKDLDLLSKTFSLAETAHNDGNVAKEWDEMLRLAAFYAFGHEDWWWLGEQLLYQCVSMHYPGDFHKQEAIAYFIIGKYLVENGKKMEAGRYYLDLARDMSEGKAWNCTKILNTKQDTVFIESCRLLYKTLTEEAVAVMKQDPQRGVEICNTARKRAAEACDHEGEHHALLLRGRCELLLNDTTSAIATIKQSLNKSMRRKNIQGICEAKIALALAYLQHGKAEDSLDCLRDLKSLAEEYELPFYVAQAHRYMGEYFLNQEQPYEATPLLLMGFYLFHDLEDLSRREKVRTWAAISAGEELFPAFIRLIQNCDESDEGHENLMKLIRWIDEKEFFWTQQSKFSFSISSLQHSILDVEI